jgi:hypothetical protein
MQKKAYIPDGRDYDKGRNVGLACTLVNTDVGLIRAHRIQQENDVHTLDNMDYIGEIKACLAGKIEDLDVNLMDLEFVPSNYPYHKVDCLISDARA